MKNRTLLIIGSLLVIMSACKKKTNETAPLSSGIHMEYFDTTVNPAEDFYQYACGGWMKLHPLTGEYSRFGSFDQLAEDNLKQLQELITSLAGQENKNGTVAQKIGDLYNIGMDSALLEKQGAEPIREMLQQIAGIRQSSEIGSKAADIALTAGSPFLGIFGEADPMNSDRKIAWIWQSGLGIGDRDYYLDKEMKPIREQYKTMITKLLEISGYGEMAGFAGKEAAMAEQLLALETRMAKAFMSKEDQRLPELTYHYASIQDFERMLGHFDVKTYMQKLGLNLDSVNIGMPDYFKALDQIIATTDLNTLKAYLAWNVINNAAPYLSSAFADTRFDFYGKAMSGKQQQQPRWKRVVHAVNGCMGEAVGQMYVEKYFPEAAKERMDRMVKNLQEALKERIRQAEWMSEATQAKAIEKLDAFHVKIGYPDKWRDYGGLKISKDSYWGNISRANEFEYRYELAKIGKPVDKDEWQMTPQTVNAYYNPSTNEICFPAGILQPPFFDMNADDAVNYGAIGVVIGHEMTHGFDDQGCKYDKYGNLANWWLPEDSANFAQRTQTLVDWFNRIEVLPGVHANGQFTLGENIADNGGLNISYTAFQKAKEAGDIQEEMDGFTADQRFFIAYAMVWAGNIRDEEITRRTKEDPHSLGKWRVNGTLPHISAFQKAFGIKEQDAMYLAPEKQAHIW